MKPQINLLIKRTAGSFSKKIIIAILAVTLIGVNAFAGGKEDKDKAAASLKKEFQTAKDVQWKFTPEYIKASFTWNDQQLEVFYNYNGETIAKSRHIEETALPLRAQQYINKKYHDCVINEAIEYSSDNSGLTYYVSLLKGGKKKILEITSEGDVSVFEK